MHMTYLDYLIKIDKSCNSCNNFKKSFMYMLTSILQIHWDQQLIFRSKNNKIDRHSKQISATTILEMLLMILYIIEYRNESEQQT
jgi:hypothetical protein